MTLLILSYFFLSFLPPSALLELFWRADYVIKSGQSPETVIIPWLSISV